jgi:TPP-dependent pyruvate/acetoin dehydrogenase alpha subunit
MQEKCPIERLKARLLRQGAAPEELDALSERARQEVLEAVTRARAAARPDPASVLDYVYQSPALQAIRG